MPYLKKAKEILSVDEPFSVSEKQLITAGVLALIGIGDALIAIGTTIHETHMEVRKGNIS